MPKSKHVKDNDLRNIARAQAAWANRMKPRTKQDDFTKLCVMARDDIDAALWRVDNPDLSADALRSAMTKIMAALTVFPKTDGV